MTGTQIPSFRPLSRLSASRVSAGTARSLSLALQARRQLAQAASRAAQR